MSVVSILAPLLIVLGIVVVPVAGMALATLSTRRQTDELTREAMSVLSDSRAERAERESMGLPSTRPPESWDRYCARDYRRVRSSSYVSPFESAPARVWEI